MRDILTEIFENQPLDPREAARRGARPTLRKRFYNRAHLGEAGPDGFPLLLDGKPVRTPARRALAAPTSPLAEKIAEEWNAQAEVIDPARMPLTRLANAVIDAVADAPGPIAAAPARTSNNTTAVMTRCASMVVRPRRPPGRWCGRSAARGRRTTRTPRRVPPRRSPATACP